MSRSILEWIGVAVALACAGAFLAVGVWLAVPCKPGDRGITVGHVMLLAGCPR
jgi:hypothetical protein